MNEQIKKIITKNLLDLNKAEVDEIYTKINNGETPELITDNLKGFYKRWAKIGVDYQIDLPFFLRADKKKDTVMIVAMDALSVKTEDRNRLILSVPFYLQSDKGKNTKRNQYWDIIKPLNENYNIYLTDIYKLFFRESNNVSNKNKKYTQDEIHASILHEEILYIKPKLIIAFGKPARDTCSKLLNIPLNNTITTDDIRDGYSFNIGSYTSKFISIPHPSGLTRPAHWKSFYSANLKDENFTDYHRRPTCISKLIMNIVN